jgi:hypothetical protein
MQPLFVGVVITRSSRVMGNQCCAHLPAIRAMLNGFMVGRAQSTEEPDSESEDDAFALSASSTSQSGD